MYSTGMAYLLWLLGGCGVCGFHRFYLGKIGSGIAYLFTGGLLTVGAIYDLFTLPSQVRKANALRLLENGYMPRDEFFGDMHEARSTFNVNRNDPPKETTEHAILRIAQARKGMVTPEQVALDTERSIDEVRKELDKMVNSRSAELHVTNQGTIVYVIRGFAPDGMEFEI